MPPDEGRPMTFGERVRHGPVTAAVALLCAALFLAKGISPEIYLAGTLQAEAVWGGEYWRLTTSNFFHVNFPHVVFNLMWWWILGFGIEVRDGTLRLVVVTLASGLTGSLAELLFPALDYPGAAGLSGAVYGLFFFGYVALRPLGGPFGMLFSKQNAQVFVGWGLLCIVLTVTGIMGVANWAHGAGALTGAALGWLWTRTGWQRAAAIAGALLVLAGLAVAGTHPIWNARYQAFLGGQAFDARDWPRAARHFGTVLEVHPDAHYARANRALVLTYSGRIEEAMAEASRLPDSYLDTMGPTNQQTIESLRTLGASPEDDSAVGSPP